MNSWQVGQRVTSSSEPELGVGIVELINHEILSVSYPVAQLKRRYALRNPPLRRLVLSVGSKAHLKSGQSGVISAVKNVEHLIHYEIDQHWFSEEELSDHQQSLGPLDQLLTGQWSDPKGFELRREGWRIKALSAQAGVRGLLGPRVNLLPHQLDLTQTVCSRVLPRVLLADEVGLGKTIEAALILSMLNRAGRADRVLILVPQALQTQWLAELYRRFHLLFTILDEQRCLDEEITDSTMNPFESSPFVLCSLELLMESETRLKQALNSEWDLMIIDEAHHLLWDESDPSPAWLAARELAGSTKGLLLLTATPRQHGLETQFGLLNLVDPERFNDFEHFKKESAQLKQMGQITRQLQGPNAIEQAKALMEMYPNDSDLAQAVKTFEQGGTSQDLILKLIDRHGPGRVLFRNRRERLKGFPKRRLIEHPLAKGEKKSEWVLQFLKDLKNEKALLITSSAEQVKQIDAYLQKHSGHKRALFHQDMTMVERDRQAAWFADPKGAQILVASEIGGEGRNFQFCHQLLLLDLPTQPDLLEQRIGRLDRIGQTQEIQIHVPYVLDSVEELYFEIYKNGMALFENASAGLAVILEKLQSPLQNMLQELDQKSKLSRKTLDPFIAQVAAETLRYKTEQENNFDPLVDLNSFNPERGNQLVAKMQKIEDSPDLEDYMSDVFEFFGVDEDDLENKYGLFRITPSQLMYVESFPELSEEKSITYSRELALSREEITFLTLDHPLVEGALGLLLDKSLGQATVCQIAHPDYESGALFEFSFLLQAPKIKGLDLENYLPTQMLSCVVDHAGKVLAPNSLRGLQVQSLGREAEILRQTLGPKIKDLLPKLYKSAQNRLSPMVNQILAGAVKKASEQLQAEEQRLLYLQKVNKSVSSLELKIFTEQAEKTIEGLSLVELRLDAVRVLLCVTTD